jgi:hypothetical protein
MGSGGKDAELIAPALDRGRAFMRERVKAAARS